MKRYLKIGAVVALVLAAVVAERLAYWYDYEQVPPGQETIEGVMVNHPEQWVRDLLDPLGDRLRIGTVKFQPSDSIYDMEVSYEPDGGKNQILLWYREGWVEAVPEADSLGDKQDLLALKLYHQLQHVEDHSAGRIKLRPLVPMGQVGTEYAQYMWDKEWSAVGAEWALAKRMEKGRLFKEIWKYNNPTENPRNFLTAFFELLRTSQERRKYEDKYWEQYVAGLASRYGEEAVKLAGK